jgi:RES domain-containing protein
MHPHPKTKQLKTGLKKLLSSAGPWEGATYRFVEVDYANRDDLLSGAGARKHGGRWNPPRFNCVYGSLDPTTAQEESYAAYDKYGIPRSKMSPRVRVAINLTLQRVLDLSSPTALKTLGVTRKELAAVDWEAEMDAGDEALTQAIGRLAFDEELEGIIVPSSRTIGGKNLVLFPGRRLAGSSWKISGAKELPKKS